jgi:hypothetical protein
MEPTELYNRSKRNLVIFAAVLALALFGVVQVSSTNTQYGVQVIPNAVPTILFVVVGYLLYQFVLARSFQPDEVRRRTRLDSAITSGFASFVLLGYLFYYLLWQVLGLQSKILLSLAAGALVSAVASLGINKWSDLAKWRREAVFLRRFALEQRLKEPGWILNYNPQFPNKTKPISFEEDGSIGEGRNANEHRWRLEQGQLIMIREDGEEHNRFLYDPTTDRFVSTRPSSKHGIAGQVIYREPT